MGFLDFIFGAAVGSSMSNHRNNRQSSSGYGSSYERGYEDGDTLIISNDTLYGYSDNPILLKRK